jgi:hypothetical protein
MTALSHLIIPLLSILTIFSLSADGPPQENVVTIETIQFTPPSNWRNAEATALPDHVQLMVVGKGNSEFPPSLSLATEHYSGTVKQYLKIIKELNASKGHEWKDLGSIKTEAGTASLSQTDSKSEWGNIRMMHVILKKNETIYILTAAALKDEFPKFYKDIFAALRSLNFSSNPKNTITP